MLSRTSTLAFIFVASLTGGCGLHTLPPPQPERVPPASEPPGNPVSPGSGRLFVDTTEGQASVSRVTEVIQPSSTNGAHPEWAGAGGHHGGGAGATMEKTQLLCITPCVVDMPIGAHKLVFQSTQDETRKSSTDVVVGPRPSAVRHTLGIQKGPNGAYFGGAVLTALGGFLVTGGGMLTAAGALGQPDDNASGKTKIGSTTPLTIGLVMLGIGVLTGTTGILLLTNNQAVHQPGSATQWSLPQ